MLFHRIQQLSRDVNQYLNHALKDEDIYMSHWAVIFQLKQFGPMTQTELKERLNIEAPPLSRTLKRLEEMEYVQKWTSQDHRTNDLQLSAKGESYYPGWEKKIKSAENRVLSQLGEQGEAELEQKLIAISSMMNGKGGQS
ncbi:MarR family transcriptional regulator [Halobacillus rhizosphaerae]|uniref:MarR family winged helix-turn-helix transcriptional regulator n=1 Tax=Halobacillus rhizosphaerae TaxID=3064889 RepID=UPI00398B4C38